MCGTVISRGRALVLFREVSTPYLRKKARVFVGFLVPSKLKTNVKEKMCRGYETSLLIVWTCRKNERKQVTKVA
jgi:hypothetical protein